MTRRKTIEILTQFNAWRLGAETPMLEPKDITRAIISAIAFLEEPNL